MHAHRYRSRSAAQVPVAGAAAGYPKCAPPVLAAHDRCMADNRYHRITAPQQGLVTVDSGKQHGAAWRHRNAGIALRLRCAWRTSLRQTARGATRSLGANARFHRAEACSSAPLTMRSIGQNVAGVAAGVGDVRPHYHDVGTKSAARCLARSGMSRAPMRNRERNGSPPCRPPGTAACRRVPVVPSGSAGERMDMTIRALGRFIGGFQSRARAGRLRPAQSARDDEVRLSFMIFASGDDDADVAAFGGGSGLQLDQSAGCQGRDCQALIDIDKISATHAQPTRDTWSQVKEKW